MTTIEDMKPRGGLLGQALRYGATGVLNTGLSYGLILICVYGFGSSILLANCVGYAAGWALSYGFNKRWTFQSPKRAAESLPAFIALVALAFGANLALAIGLTSAGLSYPVSQTLGAVAYSALVFAGLKWIVFRDV